MVVAKTIHQGIKASRSKNFGARNTVSVPFELAGMNSVQGLALEDIGRRFQLKSVNMDTRWTY